jgi:DinB superfamily
MSSPTSNPTKGKSQVALTPDTKDWTWVLERPCLECGFDSANYPADIFAQAVLASAGEWAAVLARDDVRVRTRDDRWSDLEYACHVRDMFRVMDGRVVVMLEQDNPIFQNWDQEDTALVERYDVQDPALVSDELATRADDFAARIDAVGPDEWARPGTRSNGSRFTVETLIRYSLHDVRHHLWDVSRSDG